MPISATERARRLRNLLRSLGLTQSELARRSGVKRSLIGKVLCGERAFGLKSLRQLAAGLNIPVMYFLNDVSGPLPSTSLATLQPIHPPPANRGAEPHGLSGQLPGMSIPPMEEAKRLRDLFGSLGMTQAEVSRRSGIQKGMLSRVMNGHRRFGLINLRRLAAALNVPLTYFVDADPGPLPSPSLAPPPPIPPPSANGGPKGPGRQAYDVYRRMLRFAKDYHPEILGELAVLTPSKKDAADYNWWFDQYLSALPSSERYRKKRQSEALRVPRVSRAIEAEAPDPGPVGTRSFPGDETKTAEIPTEEPT